MESQTLHLGNEASQEESVEETLETRTMISVRYRLPPDGKMVVEKQFELRTPGPFDQRDIAQTAARIAGSVSWAALPSDFRAWAQALSTVIVMFRGQADHEWLVARCERNPVMLEKVAGEVDAFWAATFPQGYLVGEGESSESVASVEVTQTGPRRAPAGSARPARRTPGVATVR